jgi:hypothetical protein
LDVVIFMRFVYMKKSQVITGLAACIFAASLFGISSMQRSVAQSKSSPATPPAKATQEKVQLLFVQNATAGTFDGKTLTLEGIGHTLFFSDRPERVTGQVKTSEFIGHWDKGSDNFAASPPNATLSTFGDSAVNSAVVELTKPTLNKNTLSYEVKVLKGNLPKSFKESSLFIDILGRWRMYAAGEAAGAAAAGAYYYHPPVYAAPVYAAPVYVAPRPIVVY